MKLYIRNDRTGKIEPLEIDPMIDLPNDLQRGMVIEIPNKSEVESREYKRYLLEAVTLRYQYLYSEWRIFGFVRELGPDNQNAAWVPENLPDE